MRKRGRAGRAQIRTCRPTAISPPRPAWSTTAYAIRDGERPTPGSALRAVPGAGSIRAGTPIVDYDPAQAIKSRKAILDRVATDRIMVMGYHFPFPAIGHVVRRDTAYHWEAAQWAW
jgi:hypothetical protein